MRNVFLGLLLVLGPIAGYFLGGKTNQGLFVGLGLAALVLAIYIILERVPLDTMAFGAIGAFIGVIVAKAFDWLVVKTDIPTLHGFMETNTLLIYLFIGTLGMMVAVRKKSELDLLDKNIIVKGNRSQDVKVLDTSVLIDGRIFDVVQTGFLSGKLIVPRFVLHELQQVADSSDAAKRQRGRRGMDILKKLQDEDDVNLKVYDKDYPQIKEVDSKVLELAKELGGKVATTDFNLNKVAALQGIPILNINDLAGALKSVVLPGDSITLYLAKEGKERSQAIGYLDDGTMIVVEEGRRHIGKRAIVHVNSILQTSAGRMIFGKVQDVKSSPQEKGNDSDQDVEITQG